MGPANPNSPGARQSAIDRDPALNDAPVEVPASAKCKGGSRFRATVDVFFHVVSDGTNGNVSDVQSPTELLQ